MSRACGLTVLKGLGLLLGLLAGLGKRLQNLVARAEHLLLAITQHKNFIDHLKDAGAMGNDHETGAQGFALGNHAGQGGVTGLIKAAVGLIEHHKLRIAVDGARNGHTLALPAR